MITELEREAQREATRLAQELGLTHAGHPDSKAIITYTPTGVRVVVTRWTDGVTRSSKIDARAFLNREPKA